MDHCGKEEYSEKGRNNRKLTKQFKIEEKPQKLLLPEGESQINQKQPEKQHPHDLHYRYQNLVICLIFVSKEFLMPVIVSHHESIVPHPLLIVVAQIIIVLHILL